MPILNVSINNPTTHSPQTRRFEAVVDSGAPDCYFHGSIGRAIGLKIDKGTKSTIGGIVAAAAIDVYFHDVALWIGTDTLKIRAGFSDQISVAAILGRRGFFENSSSHSIRLPIRQESTFSDLATRNPLLILRLGRTPPQTVQVAAACERSTPGLSTDSRYVSCFPSTPFQQILTPGLAAGVSELYGGRYQISAPGGARISSTPRNLCTPRSRYWSACAHTARGRTRARPQDVRSTSEDEDL